MSPTPTERLTVLVVSAVQLVNVLSFMIVMPLGPDFAAALGIPVSDLGVVGGSYTLAAAGAGLLGATVLDRFGRRRALLVALLGLTLATAAAGFAWDLRSLLATRVLAGLCGGPATSLALAIIADVVPPARRGQAVGTVMGAFSVAAVFGVPAGLELARLGSWRTPFFAVAGAGLAVAVAARALLPALPPAVRAAAAPPRGALVLLRRPPVLLTLAAAASVMIGVFALVPNLATWAQHNAGYPRARLGLLYLVGGLLSFAATYAAGPAVDRFGATAVALVGTVIASASILLGFVGAAPLLPVIAIFSGFMISGAVRSVALTTLSSRVPAADERARFMSLLSAVQHLAAAAGAMVAALLLTELPGGRLVGLPTVALLAVALGLLLPVFLGLAELRLRRAAPAPLAPLPGSAAAPVDR